MERHLRSAWVSGWWLSRVIVVVVATAAVAAVAAVAVTTKVLSKLFSRASRVEGSWKTVPDLDRRNRSARFVAQRSKGRDKEETKWKEKIKYNGHGSFNAFGCLLRSF